MRQWKWMKHQYGRLMAAMMVQLLMLWASNAWAVTSIGLGQAGKNAGNQVKGLSFMLWMAALLIGFGLVVFGIVKFATNRNNKEPTTVPLLMILGGALLVAVPSVIAMMQVSVFGSSSAGSAMSSLGIGG